MKDIQFVIVGGTFDEKKGKPSGLIHKIISDAHEYLRDSLSTGLESRVTSWNGGNYRDLSGILRQLAADPPDIVLWAPNIPNSLPKIQGFKSAFPRSILISTKNAYDKEYNWNEIIAHSLSLKANLTIVFHKKKRNSFEMSTIDPLGNLWCPQTRDVKTLVSNTLQRAIDLTNFTRFPSTQLTEGSFTILPKDADSFFRFIQECAKKFEELICPANGITRFLGNGSFRCTLGFPSYRSPSNLIFVTKRNLDKTQLNKDGFLPVFLSPDEREVFYRGKDKPSVDTPIQLLLYKKFPKINYMVHSHCYVEGAPFTSSAIPCGAIEEVEEVKKVLNSLIEARGKELTSAAVNLKGHGSLLLSEKVEELYPYFFQFKTKTIPEPLYQDLDKETIWERHAKLMSGLGFKTTDLSSLSEFLSLLEEAPE